MQVTAYVKKTIDENFNGQLIMLTISGSHLYGWESVDSDIDWRGVYLAGTENFLGLQRPRTFNLNELKPYDLELKELGHFLNLGLAGNCNVLDTINSRPIYRTPQAIELRQIINNTITKDGVFHSYMGLAESNYTKFILGGTGITYKKYLYIIRAICAGTHILQTGVVQPNMKELNKYFKLPEVKTLLKHKREGGEEEAVGDLVLSGRLDELIPSLIERMEKAYIKSKLPTEREEKEIKGVNNWLMKQRIKKIGM